MCIWSSYQRSKQLAHHTHTLGILMLIPLVMCHTHIPDIQDLFVCVYMSMFLPVAYPNFFSRPFLSLSLTQSLCPSYYNWIHGDVPFIPFYSFILIPFHWIITRISIKGMSFLLSTIYIQYSCSFFPPVYASMYNVQFSLHFYFALHLICFVIFFCIFFLYFIATRSAQHTHTHK